MSGTLDLDVSTLTCTDGLSSSGSGSKLSGAVKAGFGAILGPGRGKMGGSMGAKRGGACGTSVGSVSSTGGGKGAGDAMGSMGPIGNTLGVRSSGFTCGGAACGTSRFGRKTRLIDGRGSTAGLMEGRSFNGTSFALSPSLSSASS